MLFLAVTAEEQGLLGSAYYAENPIYPVNKTIANLNTDALLPVSGTSDIEIVGYGQSELEDYAKTIADRQGRKIKPDPNPGAGSFFRSDHFNFAKVGIPALYAKGSNVEVDEVYAANDYHQPSDEYSADWDMSGMILDAKLLFEVGLQLSNENTYPQWKQGSEFKAIREKSMND